MDKSIVELLRHYYSSMKTTMATPSLRDMRNPHKIVVEISYMK
jgi:hypothetical protein